jgi:hypothetical protein
LKKAKIWIPVLVLIAVLVAGALWAHDYFTTEADDQANAYRAEITRPIERAADTMDVVFNSFDHYTRSGLIARERIRSADDTEELKRRVIPTIHEQLEALHEAKVTGDKAAKVLADSAKPLDHTPEPPWMLDGDDVYDDIAATRRHADQYLRESKSYLRDFDRFIEYQIDATKLHLQSWQDLSDVGADPTLEELKSYGESELAEVNAQRKMALKLDPLPDTKKLYDLDLESINIDIDFLEDFIQAFDTLDQSLLDAAYADLRADLKGLKRKGDLAAWEFSAHSHLREAMGPMCNHADSLEKEVARIGEGGGDHSRVHLPPPPPSKPVFPNGSGGGDGDNESAA